MLRGAIIAAEDTNRQIPMDEWNKKYGTFSHLYGNEPTNPLDKYVHSPLKIYTYPQSLDTDQYMSSRMVLTIMSDSDVSLETNPQFGKTRINGTGSDFLSKLGKSGANLVDKVSGITQDDIISSLKSSFDSVVDIVTDVYDKGWNGLSDVFSDATSTAINGMRNFDGTSIGVSGKVDKVTAQIIIPIPENGVSVNYGVQYSSEAMGLGAALNDAVMSGNSISEILKSSKSAAGSMGMDIVAASAASAVGGNNTFINPEGQVQALRRSIFNPRKEQLFKGVNMREFHFQHTFAPCSQSECDTVKKIIDLLKTNMLPNLTGNGLYLRYPSEFKIEYFYGLYETEYVNAISDCVLVNLNVHYGSGSWSTLVNGHPTTLTMSTTFQELMPLTRDKMIEEGL